MVNVCTPESGNVRAFLKLLRYAENWPREDDDVYNNLFGGGTFSDMSKHPNRLVTIGNYSSTAAGAYQILFKTWQRAKSDGIAPDFSKASQDAVAFSKLQSRGALQPVCDGQFETAVAHLRSEWVSLPGASQSHVSMNDAKQRFQQYVTEYSK